MAFNTYSDLKAALANWLARSDLTSYYDDIITLGERRLARDLRIRGIEEDLSVTISSGVAVIPTDFLELKSSRLDLSQSQPLEPKDSQWVMRRYPQRSSSGRPYFIAPEGLNFIFGPYPDQDYVVKGIYYKRPTILSSSNTTNEWTTHCDDALLLASLAESAPFLKHDKRVQMWEGKYAEIKRGYTVQQKRQARRGATTSYR